MRSRFSTPPAARLPGPVGPSSLPDDRINGPAALFVAPGPFGLRLVHVRPITETGRETLRLGSVAAEHLLTRDAVGRAGSHADFTLSTSLVPVSLRPRYEGGGESVPPYGFLLGLPGSAAACSKRRSHRRICETLRAGVAQARSRASRSRCSRSRCSASPCSPGKARSARPHAPGIYEYTGGLLLLLVGARALLALAIPDTWLLKLSAPMAERLLLRSPADFVATALLFLVLVALAGDLVERWRLTSRQPEPRGPSGEAAFWTANVLVAAIIGVLLAWHEHALAAVVRESGAFGIQFSIRPLSPTGWRWSLARC